MLPESGSQLQLGLATHHYANDVLHIGLDMRGLLEGEKDALS